MTARYRFPCSPTFSALTTFQNPATDISSSPQCLAPECFRYSSKTSREVGGAKGIYQKESHAAVLPYGLRGNRPVIPRAFTGRNIAILSPPSKFKRDESR
jgi:hypothetical protein